MSFGRKLALFGMIVVFLGASVFAFFLGAKRQKTHAANDLDAIRKLGFPTTFADYTAQEPRDPKDDALPIYRKYSEAVSHLGGTRATDFQALTDSYDPSDPAALIIIKSKDLADLIDLLIQGSNKKYWGEAGLLSPTYDAEVMWKGVPMLEHAASAYESTGDIDTGLKLLAAASRIEKQSGDPAEWLGLESTLTNDLGQWLRHHPKDPVAIQKIIDFMNANYKPVDFRRYLELDFVSSLEADKADPPPGVTPTAAAQLKYKTVTKPQSIRQNQLEMAMWKRTFANLPKNPCDWSATQAAMQSAIVTPKDREIAASDMSNFGGTAGALNAFGGAIAWRKIQMTAARLFLVRAKTGSLPKKLFDDPILPDHMELNDLSDIDPFTGKPFDYFPTATGFRLHTVGRRGRNMNAIY